jgi:hypothetical protein
MSYNHFNNDLPVPPKGYADWRAFYASSLAAFSAFGDATDPQNGRVVVPTGNHDLTEIPYWKIAHYAAREQALYDQEHPPLSYEQLDELFGLLHSTFQKPSTSLFEWVRARLKEVVERRVR